MSKEVYIGVRVSQETIFELSNYLRLNPHLKQSDVIRLAIEEFLKNNNPSFLDKKIEECKGLLTKLNETKQLIKLKEKNLIKLPSKEIEFLLESKDKIEEKPSLIQGRIESYITLFKKPFKITESDFFKLISEAEKQCKN